MRTHSKHNVKPKRIAAKAAVAVQPGSRKVMKQKKLSPGQLMVKKITGIATVKISADKVLSITRGRP